VFQINDLLVDQKTIGKLGSGHMKPDAEYQRRLERENRQLENEVEFLKKAPAYFAGDQRKGTR
jgi:transposase